MQIALDAMGTVWVVYRMAAFAKHGGHNAICTQAEWEAKESAAPGQNTLIRGGIANEGQAERMARDLQTPPAAERKPRPRAERTRAAVLAPLQ